MKIAQYSILHFFNLATEHLECVKINQQNSEEKKYCTCNLKNTQVFPSIYEQIYFGILYCWVLIPPCHRAKVRHCDNGIEIIICSAWWKWNYILK